MHATRFRILFFAAITVFAIPSAALPQMQRGLVVETVPQNSAGGKAGLRPGDRLLAYEGRPLDSTSALQAAEDNTFGKESVILSVQRADVTLTLTVPAAKLGIQVRPDLFPTALTLYEEGRTAQAAKAAQEAGDSESAAWLYGRVASVHEAQRQWKEAREAHLSAWKLLEWSGDRTAQSRALAALGRCSQNLSDFPAAQQWYEQAAQIDSAAGNERWAASDFQSLGNVAFFRGDLQTAQGYYSRSLSIDDRLAPDSMDVASSLSGLGNVASSLSDFAAAEEYYSRALEIRKRLRPNSPDVAGSLSGLGIVAWYRGDLDAAQTYHDESLAINQKVSPDSIAVATNLNNLGIVASSRGDIATAEKHQSRVLEIRERLSPNSQELAIALNNVGNIALSRGDFAAAEDYHNRALEIRERLSPDSLNVVASLSNLGLIAWNRRDFAAAHEYYSRALSISERLAPGSLPVAGSLGFLGNVAFDRGDIVAADNYYKRALEIRERLSPDSLALATSLSNLGEVAFARNDLSAALEFGNRALAMKERLAPNSLAVADSLENLGEIAFKERRFSAARTFYSRAVDIVESQRWQIQTPQARALLLARHAERYIYLMRADVALNDLPAAFATAERARARSLLEVLNEGRAQIRQGIDPQLLERERQIQQQLNAKANSPRQTAATRKEVDVLLLQYEDIQAQIRQKSPQYAALMQPQPLGLKDIQHQVLDENALLLEYALGDEISFLFAVARNSIRVFELPKRGEIEKSARRVAELLMARQPVRGETPQQRQARIKKADTEYAAAAMALSQMVLGPMAGLLTDQRLLIVADGALQLIPFAALPLPGREASSFMIVNHEIVSLPSASVLAVQRRELTGRRPAPQQIAVLADPVFDLQDPRLKAQRSAGTLAAVNLPAEIQQAVRNAGIADDRGTLSRLPFTREEADAIVALAPAGQGIKAVDFKANRTMATTAGLGDYRIVHLATHGLVDTERPELSGIVLSLVDEQGKPQDGFLRLHDVYNLNWSADLVVLSACQTALGKEIRGEGLMGLARGFMYAGAKGVVASLWNVNDSGTAFFMKRFYEGMFAKGLPPAAALRAAQLEMSKRNAWRSPYYWAAFGFQGEWR